MPHFFRVDLSIMFLERRAIVLTSHDGNSVDVFSIDALSSSQEEADTRIVLHCMHVRDTEPDNTTILVSPQTWMF